MQIIFDDEGLVDKVAQRLRSECQQVFGSTWCNDVAWRFAKAAIEVIRNDEGTRAGKPIKPRLIIDG